VHISEVSKRRSSLYRIFYRWLGYVAIPSGLLSVCCSLPAQTSQPATSQTPKTSPATAQILASFEGQNVTLVQIAGRPESTTAQFSPLFVQQAGQPFSKEKVEQTVAALKATGKFKEIQLQVDPEANGVRVLLVLEPAVYFGMFKFPGAEQFPYSRLIQVANFPPEAPFNADDVEQDRQSLVTFFRQEGYFRVEVRPEIQIDADHLIANVLFRTTLNKKARFGVIEIADATPEDAARMSRSLRTIIARARGAAIRPGKSYQRGALSKATRYLQSRLEKQGRLGAQVQLQGAEYHADTNRADIHFDVKPGPLVKVDVQGAHLWSWTKKSLLPVYQGIGVDEESVQEGRQALVSYFQAKGYFDVKVDARYKKDRESDSIVYQITKNAKHKVAAVQLTGNSQLPNGDLTSRITVQKSHLFSPGNYSEKLVRDSTKNLTAIYQSEGFSSVQVTSKVENAGGNIRIVFHVTEGPRDVVSSLRIEGADTFPQIKFAPAGLKLAEGKPYSQKFVQSDRANIVAHYLQAGYLTASFRQTASVVSKNDSHHINVVYHIYEGPEVLTDSIVTLGRLRTKQRLIDQDLASIKPEQPLTETQLLTSESQLYEHTGVFDWAEVDPKRKITTQTKEDVLVKVHEAKKNQITYGFGFEVVNRGGSVPSGTVALPNLPPVGLPSTFTTNQTTFFGPRGTFQYTRNNLRGKGESLSFTGFAGRLDQRVAAFYIDPRFRWSKWKSTASFSVERDQRNPIFSSQEELGSYQLQRFLDSQKADTLFLRYSFSQTDLTRIEIPALVRPEDQHVRLSTLAANLTRDTRDNVLDEHKGVLQTLELDFNITKLGSSVDFVKLTAQAAYYKPIFHNIIWANSVRIGLAQPFGGYRVPLSEEFFTGGGNTLRGFPLDGAGPQRQIPACSAGSTTNCTLIQVPSGGNELLLINSEVRVPLPVKKGLGIVAFYDGGNVFPLVGFHNFTSLYSNNVGVGLRYATPVGPVRIDLGRNLNPIPGIQATQYFISIGQAF
jgi:outer membrane protein assembly factor BamA